MQPHVLSGVHFFFLIHLFPQHEKDREYPTERLTVSPQYGLKEFTS